MSETTAAGSPLAHEEHPLAEHTDRRLHLAELRERLYAAGWHERLWDRWRDDPEELVRVIVEIAGEAWDDGHNTGYPAAANDVRSDMEGYLHDLQRCCRILGDENFDTSRFLLLYAEKCRRQG